MKESEPSHNLVVQLNEFFFGKRININVSHRGLSFTMIVILHRKLGVWQPDLVSGPALVL
jgi:hypothetical protein